MDGLLQNCRIKNRLLRECLAEFLGVYVLIVSKEEDAKTSVKSPGAADDDPETREASTTILRRFVNQQKVKVRTLSPKVDRKRES